MDLERGDNMLDAYLRNNLRITATSQYLRDGIDCVIASGRRT